MKTNTANTRTETDSFGPIQVPADKYWVMHFKIGNEGLRGFSLRQTLSNNQQAINFIKVPIFSINRHALLKSDGGDPDVIGRDRCSVIF